MVNYCSQKKLLMNQNKVVSKHKIKKTNLQINRMALMRLIFRKEMRKKIKKINNPTDYFKSQ